MELICLLIHAHTILIYSCSFSTMTVNIHYIILSCTLWYKRRRVLRELHADLLVSLFLFFFSDYLNSIVFYYVFFNVFFNVHCPCLSLARHIFFFYSTLAIFQLSRISWIRLLIYIKCSPLHKKKCK